MNYSVGSSLYAKRVNSPPAWFDLSPQARDSGSDPDEHSP